MNLAALCIRRPVFTTMLVAAPIVLGIVSYVRLGVDLFPNVDLPIVTITTTLPGASVEEMETGVTKPLEEAVNTVAGIDELKSVTKEGISSLVVQFLLEKNRDVAAQEVRDKVSTILSQLPSGTTTPVIDKFDLDASPVLTVAVSGRRSLREVSEIADKRIREGLESLTGVGRVTVAGARLRAINVYVEAAKLEAFNLSIDQVRRSLISQNLELPGGRVDQSGRELVLRTMGRVKESREFDDVIVAQLAGQPVRVRDIGHAEDSEEEPRTLARLDGANAVTLVVQKQSGTNTLAVIETVKARLNELKRTLPEDVTLQVIRDQSTFISGSIHEVQKHLILGAILVAVTIYVFLRDWRTMILAGLAIPVCIVSTFTLMNALGFTLNNITMLGLVLAVGIVIDDAIVIHENIFRWMEEKGFPAKKAAELATSEIALAVLATTLSLVVIFLPIAFMQGRVGRFFQSFGITIAFSIMISLGVAFTMTPMLCSIFLKLSKHAGHVAGGIYERLAERPYMATLRFAMRFRWLIVLLTIACMGSIVPLFKAVGKDFIPKDDQSEFEITVTAPEGWTLDRISRELEIVEARVKQLPAVEHILTTIGDVSGRVGKGAGDVTKASIYVRLAELDERVQGPFDRLVAKWPPLGRLLHVKVLDPKLQGVSQFQVMGMARKLMASFPDLRSSVSLPAAVASGAANADVEFNVLGPDLQKLAEYSDEIMRRMREVKGIVDVDTTLALRKPELRVVIDREKAMDLGIPVQTIAATLRVFVGGEIVTNYKDDEAGEQYDVWLRAVREDRDDPHVIEGLTVPSPSAGLVKVANLAALRDARGPSQIDRFARQRKVTIVCNAEPGTPIGTVVENVQRITKEMNLPPAYSIYFTGRAKTLAETGVNFIIAFGLSLAFMYMILAAQFESFVHPVTILLAVPLTIPFAILSLLLLRQALDIYAIFGLFLLFGIVKKNGILQVDYTNVLREQGVPRDQAILDANRTRLRPILMTTVMLIAGMVPIALGVGPGTGSRASLAKVIVGGQSLSLLLSLLVTPVAYSYFDDLAQWWRRKFPAAPEEGEVANAPPEPAAAH